MSAQPDPFGGPNGDPEAVPVEPSDDRCDSLGGWLSLQLEQLAARGAPPPPLQVRPVTGEDENNYGRHPSGASGRGQPRLQRRRTSAAHSWLSALASNNAEAAEPAVADVAAPGPHQSQPFHQSDPLAQETYAHVDPLADTRWPLLLQRSEGYRAGLLLPSLSASHGDLVGAHERRQERLAARELAWAQERAQRELRMRAQLAQQEEERQEREATEAQAKLSKQRRKAAAAAQQDTDSGKTLSTPSGMRGKRRGPGRPRWSNSESAIARRAARSRMNDGGLSGRRRRRTPATASSRKRRKGSRDDDDDEDQEEAEDAEADRRLEMELDDDEDEDGEGGEDNDGGEDGDDNMDVDEDESTPARRGASHNSNSAKKSARGGKTSPASGRGARGGATISRRGRAGSRLGRGRLRFSRSDSSDEQEDAGDDRDADRDEDDGAAVEVWSDNDDGDNQTGDGDSNKGDSATESTKTSSASPKTSSSSPSSPTSSASSSSASSSGQTSKELVVVLDGTRTRGTPSPKEQQEKPKTEGESQAAVPDAESQQSQQQPQPEQQQQRLTLVLPALRRRASNGDSPSPTGTPGDNSASGDTSAQPGSSSDGTAETASSTRTVSGVKSEPSEESTAGRGSQASASVAASQEHRPVSGVSGPEPSSTATAESNVKTEEISSSNTDSSVQSQQPSKPLQPLSTASVKPESPVDARARAIALAEMQQARQRQLELLLRSEDLFRERQARNQLGLLQEHDEWRRQLQDSGLVDEGDSVARPGSGNALSSSSGGGSSSQDLADPDADAADDIPGLPANCSKAAALSSAAFLGAHVTPGLLDEAPEGPAAALSLSGVFPGDALERYQRRAQLLQLLLQPRIHLYQSLVRAPVAQLVSQAQDLALGGPGVRHLDDAETLVAGLLDGHEPQVGPGSPDMYAHSHTRVLRPAGLLELARLRQEYRRREHQRAYRKQWKRQQREKARKQAQRELDGEDSTPQSTPRRTTGRKRRRTSSTSGQPGDESESGHPSGEAGVDDSMAPSTPGATASSSSSSSGTTTASSPQLAPPKIPHHSPYAHLGAAAQAFLKTPPARARLQELRSQVQKQPAVLSSADPFWGVQATALPLSFAGHIGTSGTGSNAEPQPVELDPLGDRDAAVVAQDEQAWVGEGLRRSLKRLKRLGRQLDTSGGGGSRVGNVHPASGGAANVGGRFGLGPRASAGVGTALPSSWSALHQQELRLTNGRIPVAQLPIRVIDGRSECYELFGVGQTELLSRPGPDFTASLLATLESEGALGPTSQASVRINAPAKTGVEAGVQAEASQQEAGSGSKMVDDAPEAESAAPGVAGAVEDSSEHAGALRGLSLDTSDDPVRRAEDRRRAIRLSQALADCGRQRVRLFRPQRLPLPPAVLGEPQFVQLLPAGHQGVLP